MSIPPRCPPKRALLTNKGPGLRYLLRPPYLTCGFSLSGPFRRRGVSRCWPHESHPPPAEAVEEADIQTTVAARREWVAAGRPGSVSHDEAMAELLGDA